MASPSGAKRWASTVRREGEAGGELFGRLIRIFIIVKPFEIERVSAISGPHGVVDAVWGQIVPGGGRSGSNRGAVVELC